MLADSMREWGYTGTEAVSKMIGFLYGMEGRFNSTAEAAEALDLTFKQMANPETRG